MPETRQSNTTEKEKDLKNKKSDEPPPSLDKIQQMMEKLLEKYELKKMKTEISEIRTSMTHTEEISEEAKQAANKAMEEVDELRTEVDSLKKKLKSEEESRLRAECYQRRVNLRFYGVTETKGSKEENTQTEQLLVAILQEHMDLPPPMIEICHRIGQKTSSPIPRPILVTFRLLKERNEVWRNKKKT